MKKKLVRPAVLLVVFAASLLFFSYVTRTTKVELAEETTEWNIPVVYLQYQETDINPLLGYLGEMELTTLRDSITPVCEEGTISLRVALEEDAFEGLSFQVRTLDGSRLMEATQVTEYTVEENELYATLSLQPLLEESQEYWLSIFLDYQGETIGYYTRIILGEDSYTEEILAFAQEFFEKCRDEESLSDLATYLESSSAGDNTTLQTVTINSSLTQVGWADLEHTVLGDVELSFKEINSSYTAFTLSYMVQSTEETGVSYYTVEEYFRVRYSSANERILLLDYNRTMEEVLTLSENLVTTSGLLLGIRDTEVTYAANSDQSMIAFVQAGELWGYVRGNNQICSIYTFRSSTDTQVTGAMEDHDISVIRVDDDGNVDFVVYGYMNQGTYQGYTGIALYGYDATNHTLQEKLFLPVGQSYEVLKETWGQLFYLGANQVFYVLAEESLYGISLEEGIATLIRENLTEGTFAISADNRYIAWQEEGTIRVMDLEDGTSMTLFSVGQILIPIGFIEDDFVYGVMEEEGEYFSSLVIVDETGTLLKEYKKDGYWISKAYIEDSTVVIERVTKNGDTYVTATGDAIRNQSLESAQSLSVETTYDSVKETQVVLTTTKKITTGTPQLLTTQLLSAEGELYLSLTPEEATPHYYVYWAGKVMLSTTDAAEAVVAADECAGVVMLEHTTCIWSRAKSTSVSLASKALLTKTEYAALNSAGEICLTAMLKAVGVSLDLSGLLLAGTEMTEVLQEALPEALVLDLTGATSSLVLYYVSQGSPVYALGEDLTPVVIVGYDSNYVTLYRPSTNSTQKKSLSAALAYFEAGGNVFFTFLN